MSVSNIRLVLLAGVAVVAPAQLAAQAVPVPDPAIAPAPVATPAGSRRVFTPADFARFAPKTAYDMLGQVPGFTIRSAGNERGLGQASENVLVNGQRIANKSGGAIDELQKISASNVARIEIVEAAAIGIAGLSGEVANVIVTAARKSSGQFEWRPDVRAHYARPNLYRGSVSYSGQSGPVDYTLSIKNQANRGAFGGPVRIYDPLGNQTELREQVIHNENDLVTFQTKFKFDAPGTSLANLTLAYTPYWVPSHNRERRIRADGDNRTRSTRSTLNGWYYDVSGDYEFGVGPGRLKLIGLRHWDKEPSLTTQVTRFDSGAFAQGVRLFRDSRISETVARAEYGWKGGANDWQLSLERAFNKLDQKGSLAQLDPAGAFNPVPFPGGSGIVEETRYEAIGTFSRALSSKLDLQIAGGGEISSLDRVDGDLPPRKFVRPKGSVTLGWRPAKGWDSSFKLARRVGQISFYDFLSQPNLQQDRGNSGNPDLVPPQSWQAEAEVGRDLGAWGKTRLKLYRHWITDIIDIIPIGENGEAIGNLPSAKRLGAEWTSTFQLDPIGWTGAKLDLSLGFQSTRVADPLTGVPRPISGTRDRFGEISLRHDIPGSKFAWGFEASHNHNAKNFFLSEISRSWEGPVFASVFVEHKDVFGMTVRGNVGNLFNARHRFERTVYAGRRERDPVAFLQENNQLIGPIFSLLVKGNF